MRNTASYFKAPRQRLAQIVVVGNPSLESFVESLALDAEQVTFEGIAAPALESQQIDQKRRDEMLIDVQDKLTQLVSGAKKTGPLQIFLLDGKGLAAGNAASQSTMHALAHSALASSRHTVAAFLPEVNGTDPVVDPLPEEDATAVSLEAMKGVVADFLKARGVPLAYSVEQLREILQTC